MRTATVVGAGVFGVWTAHALKERGWRVTLIDQHGPANSRSSSGGESRIIRCGYGPQVMYSRWARESLAEWLALELRVGETLFARTGVLFLASTPGWLRETAATLETEGVPYTYIEPAELHRRFPQLHFGDAPALFEPGAGVLFSRRAVQALARILIDDGVRFSRRVVEPEREISESDADAIVFACGPWLPTLFPGVLSGAIIPTRQEVFFFGPPAGDAQFSPGPMPSWVAFDEGVYGMPDLEHRGVKIAIDAHGPKAHPERMDRIVESAAVHRVRDLLRQRLPALADAPLLEARVCQYENTTDGHLLLDRLPDHDRVWIAGGGSGHGFKHGPAVGRYMSELIEGRRDPEPAFSLAGRPPRLRAVY